MSRGFTPRCAFTSSDLFFFVQNMAPLSSGQRVPRVTIAEGNITNAGAILAPLLSGGTMLVRGCSSSSSTSSNSSSSSKLLFYVTFSAQIVI